MGKDILPTSIMRSCLLIVACFSFLSCKQSDSKKTRKIEELRYTAYSWHMGADSAKFYIAHSLDIDTKGRYLLLRHNTFIDSPKYFMGIVNGTVLSLIDETLGDTTYQRKYDYTKPVIYDGYTYSFDFIDKFGHRNTIQFIPSQSPKGIQLLCEKLDTLIYLTPHTPTAALNISIDTSGLIRQSLDHLMPKLMPPKVDIRKKKDSKE